MAEMAWATCSSFCLLGVVQCAPCRRAPVSRMVSEASIVLKPKACRPCRPRRLRFPNAKCPMATTARTQAFGGAARLNASHAFWFA